MASPPIKMTVLTRIVRCILGLILIVPSLVIMLLLAGSCLAGAQRPDLGDPVFDRALCVLFCLLCGVPATGGVLLIRPVFKGVISGEIRAIAREMREFAEDRKNNSVTQSCAKDTQRTAKKKP